MKAVVQIPSYQEGANVLTTGEAIADQPVPRGFDVDIEAWVTLSPPDRSLCDTWQAAVAARGVTAYEAPQGKLSARNAAHAHAVEEGYDIIFSWDADAPPLTDNCLASMLSAFEEESVVAVNSIPVSNDGDSLYHGMIDIVARVEDTVFPHIHGQAHGVTADAWETVGPFRENLDETDLIQVRAEEEFGFYRKLRQLGSVRTPPDAVVYNDPRRMDCKIPLIGDPDYCGERGVSTFQPRD